MIERRVGVFFVAIIKTIEAIQSERTDRSQLIENRRIMTKGEQTRRRTVEAAGPIFNKRTRNCGNGITDQISKAGRDRSTPMCRAAVWNARSKEVEDGPANSGVWSAVVLGEIVGEELVAQAGLLPRGPMGANENGVSYRSGDDWVTAER
jgi:hypothetical protein